MLPAALNTRSDGVLVAVMHRYFLAMFAIKGNRLPFFFHHSSGLSSPSITSSCK